MRLPFGRRNKPSDSEKSLPLVGEKGRITFYHRFLITELEGGTSRRIDVDLKQAIREIDKYGNHKERNITIVCKSEFFDGEVLKVVEISQPGTTRRYYVTYDDFMSLKVLD